MLDVLENRLAPAAAFALSGSNLLAFDTATPGQTSALAITGVSASETLVGIDFRPQNGLLYGLGVNATADTATLYLISHRTGVATPVGTAGQVQFTTDGTTAVNLPDPTTAGYGFDFNPGADTVRVTTSSGLNFRIDPNTGAPIDGDNGGAVTTGINPDAAINGSGSTGVSATAYTNNQPNSGGITTLYTLDEASHSLFIQNPPDGGTQTLGQTVKLGGNTLNFTAINGFDIPAGVNATTSNTPVAAGLGFAVLNVAGTTGLYSIDLTNGQATLLGNVGNGTTAVQGFAVQSNQGGLPAIALDATGTSLVRFNTATPANATNQPITGVAAGEQLVGIDYRPQTGQLYGLGVNATADTATLYLIDPQTGAVTVVGTASQIAFVEANGTTPVDLPDPATAGYGFDFNPTLDIIRVTTSTGLNFRVTPGTGAPVDGDGNAANGINPDAAINGSGSTGVSAAAYTNSFAQQLTGGATTLYTLDATTHSLFIQNPPDGGTQTQGQTVTLGGNTLNFTAVNGFDIPAGVSVPIANAPAAGFGFAALTVAGATHLYRIDLTTAAATDLGAVGAGTTDVAGLTLGDTPDVTPTISINNPTMAEGNSGTTTFTFTVTLSNPTSQTVTVHFATSDGTATTADNDYVANSGTLTFAPNTTTQTFTVVVNGDTKFEPNETFTATLSSPTNATIASATGTGTITNDDAQPTISINDLSQSEGNTGTTSFTFTVTLSNPSSQQVTVNFATSDGTATTADNDYAANSGTLTFAPNTTTQTFTVVVNGDKKFEPDETFTVTLTNAVNATIADATGTGTIANDDAQPTISINDVTQAEGNSGPTSFTFTVSLSNPSSQQVTVHFATSDGTATTADGDYVANSGTVTFAPNTTTQTFTVVVNGDTKVEPNETFTVTLSAPTNATIADATATGTITNDDGLPTLSINNVTKAEGNAGTTSFTFTVTLSATSSQQVTVAFATSDGTATTADGDYVANSGTLTFAPNTTTQTITVLVSGDTKVESNETFTVTLSNPTNATIASGTGTGTITNDDSAQSQQEPSVSSTVTPIGLVVLVTTADGTVTQYDSTGAHVLGSGVSSASIAFGPLGQVVLVTATDGTLTRYDANGHQVLGGGVKSASIAFSPTGEVVLVTATDGTLTRYDANGPQVLGGGVKSASVAIGPTGEIVVVTTTDGTATQYDVNGAHVLGSVQTASVGVNEFVGEVVLVVKPDRSLFLYTAEGVFFLGNIA
jgi:hypothetical protein